jgi:hypothetical protein
LAGAGAEQRERGVTAEFNGLVSHGMLMQSIERFWT